MIGRGLTEKVVEKAWEIMETLQSKGLSDEDVVAVCGSAFLFALVKLPIEQREICLASFIRHSAKIGIPVGSKPN